MFYHPYSRPSQWKIDVSLLLSTRALEIVCRTAGSWCRENVLKALLPMVNVAGKIPAFYPHCLEQPNEFGRRERT